MNDEIKKALEEIENGHGVLTATNVVAAAANPESPLHHCFEWDNSKAAHAHRLEQARTLIRSVRVVVTVDSREIKTVRYVHDPKSTTGGYLSVPRLMTTPARAQDVLRAEFSAAAGHLVRAQGLADAFGMAADVERVAKRLERTRAKLDRVVTVEQVAAGG